MKPKVIRDQAELARMAIQLKKKDPVLASVVRRLGPPPLWSRKPGLETLVRIVLEQQVSLASGRAAFEKLKASCSGRITVSRIIDLGENGMRLHGRLTRQKASYVLAIAEANHSRRLNFSALKSMSSEQVRKQLMAIKGIGVWTSDVYLLMALRRADILPLGDLALENEVARLYKLPSRPTRDWLLQCAESWRPFRAAAARVIWHSYLDYQGRHDEI